MVVDRSVSPLDLPFPASQLSWDGPDIDKAGNWIAVVDSGTGLRLVTPWSDVPLPFDLRYAAVRWLDGKALVVSGRIRKAGDVNAWIIDPVDGTILHAFSIGDGVEDVVVLKDFIAVSYFDEGVFSGISPSHEGVAIFDHSGVYLWGYTSSFTDAVDIVDCYAMCQSGPNRITFFAYTEFKLVEVDVAARQQSVRPAPLEVQGCHDLTCVKTTAILRGPYSKNGDRTAPRSEVFAVDQRGKGFELEPLPGRYARGLSNGRFLLVGDHQVDVVTFTDRD